MARTNAGLVWQAGVMGSTSSNGTGTYAPATYIGLSANTDTPSATDTILAGEISSGTLIRAQAYYSYSSGTHSYSLSHQFTSDQTITIAKIGIFTDTYQNGGTMFIETLLSSAITLHSGDTLSITETVTI